MQQPGSAAAYKTVHERIDGHKIRARSASFDDHFTQATLFWKSMAPWEQDHIVAAFSFELNQCETPEIRVAALGGILSKIDSELASRVAANIGVDLKAAIEAAPAPAFVKFESPDVSPTAKRKVKSSPALSMNKAAENIMGRKIAILVGPGVDGARVKKMKATLNEAGAIVHIVGPHGGAVEAADGAMIPIDKPAQNAASVFYDGAIVAGGADPAKMASMGLVKAFLAETFKFGKAIAAVKEAAPVIEAANLPGVTAQGASALGVFVGDKVLDDFIEALKTPRFRNRAVDEVAA